MNGNESDKEMEKRMPMLVCECFIPNGRQNDRMTK